MQTTLALCRDAQYSKKMGIFQVDGKRFSCRFMACSSGAMQCVVRKASLLWMVQGGQSLDG